MKPRFVISQRHKESSVSKEEWAYVTRSLPRNTSIGLAIITDEDSDMNGSIGSCELRIQTAIKSSNPPPPLYLDEIVEDEGARNYNYYSPFSQHLNYEIGSLVVNDFIGASSSDKAKFYRKSPRQKKFLIRTAYDLNGFKPGEEMNMELSASDNGKQLNSK